MTNLSTYLTAPVNQTPMEWWAKQDPVAIKTAELARYCGEFSTQAKTAAIIGLCLVVFAFFYFGRWRLFFVTQLGSMVVAFDKVLLISIALCFAVIITRLFFGG